MTLETYSDIVAKLNNDYDLSDERFISETELLGYLNAAIDDAEAVVHNLHHEDKYFLTASSISLVSGTQDYSLPSDIYGNKIRHLYYDDGGAKKYELLPIKDLSQIPFVQSSDLYRYLILNTTASGVKLRLYPTPAETNSYLKIFYVRNATKLTTSASASNVCEIPESVNFIYQHAKRSVVKKMRRPDLYAVEDKELKEQYDMMLSNLKEMSPDTNNLIPLDLSAYYEQSGSF